MPYATDRIIATNLRRTLFLVAVSLQVASCGADASGTSEAVVTTLAVARGDKQTGAAGSTLPDVVLTALNSSGRPVPGVIVSFAVAAGGGSVSAALDTSDAAGQVNTSWSLGHNAGDVQSLIATVTGGTGGAAQTATTVTVTATAVGGPASVLTASPSSLSSRVGDALGGPIVVTTNDAFGNRSGSMGTTVTVRMSDATRSLVGATTAIMDATGAATFPALSVTGASGTTVLTFESPGLTSARMPLTLTPGTPSVVSAASGVLQAVAGSTGPPISARVSDAWSNGVPGSDVLFSIDGVGTLGHATTGADGVATFSSWRAPGLGTFTISEVATGVATAAHQVLLSAAGAPTALTAISPPTSAPAGSTVTLTMYATDAGGNTVPGAPLDWSVTGGANGQVTTNATGIATFKITMPLALSTVQVTVRSGATPLLTLAIQTTAGSIARIAVVDGSSAIRPAGQPIKFDVMAFDALGNPLAGTPLLAYLVASVPDAGNVQSQTVATDAAGIAHFVFTADPYAESHTLTVTPPSVASPYAQIPVYTTAASGTLRVIDLGQPCQYPRGSYIISSAQVYAASGHAAQGVAVTYSVAPGNGSVATNDLTRLFSSITAIADVDGNVYAFWALPSTAGTYNITIAAPAGYVLSPVTVPCVAMP